MRFTETVLKGAYLIEPEPLEDERGFFARAWCKKAFEEKGLDASVSQMSISFNHKAGTLRGMHFQLPPGEETKIVRCTKGSVYDVIIDLRRGSETFLKWHAVELSGENRRMLYIPKGFAHGFLTLEDGTEVFYQISQPYAPDLAGGVRWNDPAFGVSWPSPVRVIAERDNSYPDFVIP